MLKMMERISEELILIMEFCNDHNMTGANISEIEYKGVQDELVYTVLDHECDEENELNSSSTWLTVRRGQVELVTQ